TALGLWLLWQSNPDLEHWKQLALDGRALLEANPWALILAVATLPAVGFPASALLILFGIVLGPRYGIVNATLLAITALAICSIWSYLLSAGPLRELLKTFVLRDRTLPTLTPQNALRIGLILRITPGIPYCLQNVALGVIGLDFKTFLFVSLPVQSLYVIGFVVTGGAIFEGQVGLAITGFAILVVIILATRLVRSRTSKLNAG
ncbi:MAG: VTT domain-containing protein, partial [Verrucomicrobiota bacterium]